ncbi:MAG: FecR domain-containing protein [Fibrobacteres bacterium]|nr:FecR domain-containing protein [Fibrobacterota bacterium]
MKNITTLILILLLSVAVFSKGAETSALVYKMKGKVSVTQPGKAESAAKAGELLLRGTKIQTGEDGLALIKLLDDNSMIRVAALSVLTLNAKGDKESEGKKGKVSLGSVLFDVQKKMNSSIFQVETPTSVATVKGTRFWIIVKNDSICITTTLEGSVEVEHSFTKEKVLVNAGESGRIVGKKLTKGASEKGDLPGGTEEKRLKVKFKDESGETRDLNIDYMETP